MLHAPSFNSLRHKKKHQENSGSKFILFTTIFLYVGLVCLFTATYIFGIDSMKKVEN